MPTNRNNVLWVIFAILALCFGGDWLWGVVVRGPMEQAKPQPKQLREKIQRRKTDLKKIREETEQLAVWETQSLPADAALARSLYQAWLVELVEHVGLVKPNVDSSEPANHKDLYNMLAFTLRGQGTLEQATQLLFEFYRSGHLHQIRSLELTPSQQGRQFNIALAIEALALPQIERQDKLGSAVGDRLVSNKLADYQIIARRNVFGAGNDPDVLAYTRLTAFTHAQGRPQAWFSVDIRGETVKRGIGETLEIGPFRGTILGIQGSDVILEIDGQRRLMSISETLSQASALPPGFPGF
jgi:hypothetical protein